ncbi:hypothetical protein EYF80_003974 [Liparis tanakae]|uniref:Secreted protein n=1 Tax=Liparis tanakae TaxID=230148 RepID=A0A4Z2J6R7_9TELE|nr:hypothetical protein EYF80_003974 [Liparis tanakae]
MWILGALLPVPLAAATDVTCRLRRPGDDVIVQPGRTPISGGSAGVLGMVSVLDAVTDVVVEVVPAMASIDEEVVAVLMEMLEETAFGLEMGAVDLVSAVLQLEVAAFSLEMGAVDLVSAGVELEDLVTACIRDFSTDFNRGIKELRVAAKRNDKCVLRPQVLENSRQTNGSKMKNCLFPAESNGLRLDSRGRSEPLRRPSGRRRTL